MPVSLDVVVHEVKDDEVYFEVKDAAEIEEEGRFEWIPKSEIVNHFEVPFKSGYAGAITVTQEWAENNGFAESVDEKKLVLAIVKKMAKTDGAFSIIEQEIYEALGVEAVNVDVGATMVELRDRGVFSMYHQTNIDEGLLFVGELK